MQRYNPKEIEPKWQGIWDETGVYTADLKSSKPKYVAMSMFNYPSGAGIHIGHAMNYTISDVKARFKRQQGFESYHPVGWDAFGLPAENYAIKAGVSPQESMATIIPSYHKQYKAMGWSNDWEKEIATHLPEYYKWTQWIFTQMFKHGLAYQDSRMQWWCTKCQTVLANEQVIDGKCWRHDGTDDPLVEKKEVKQWFFKITEYADELLDAIDGLDWTDTVKLAQKNWIGKSTGAEVEFIVASMGHPEQSEGSVLGDASATPQHDYEVKDTLKFTPELTEMIQRGDKYSTIRLEAKDLQVGDYAKLQTRYSKDDVKSFAIAKITSFETKKLRDISNEYPGHEKYTTEDEKLADYKGYYGEQVTLDTEFVVYTFEKAADIITVFTTRPDTLFGVTFMVLAPELEIVSRITTTEQKQAVEDYIVASGKKSEVERQASKEKSGVFTGAYAVNPINGERIPVWIADYVLAGYGTGAIMAVPAHDERDNEFAKAFNLPIKQVVAERFTHAENEHQPEKPTVPRQVVCVVVEHPSEKKYLIAKPHGSEFWSPVMGGIDEGETAVEAAKRELLEESGYSEVASAELCGDVIASEFYAQHKGVNRIAYIQTVKVKLASLNKTEGAAVDEAEQELKWATKAEVDELCVGAGAKEIYEFAAGVERPMALEGRLINSGDFDGVSTSEARETIVTELAMYGVGQEKINYRMRDWSVSRQRYWGAPIPIVNCKEHGAVLVPDDQLPVILPELDDFQPSGDGRSALARATDWLQATCPECGGPAERETDTLDTYICSSWYMYRYFDPRNTEKIFDSEIVKKWEPIDFYNGGDHATAHLLYARFIGHFFKTLGLVDEPEPFKQFLFNGKVTAADGTMFSKSKGNGIDPLEIINQGYGADSLRTYLMFAAPLEVWAKWDPQGVPGAYRFLSRIWTLVQEYHETVEDTVDGSVQKDLRRATHAMVKKMTEDIQENRYNTAIAAAMGTVNDLYKLKTKQFVKSDAWQEALEAVVACVAPFAPHTADELWFQLGHHLSVHKDTWPKWDEQYLVSDEVTIAVQVNGKLRGTVQVAADADQAATVEAAKADVKIAANLEGKDIVKTVYVPAKLLNFVVK